MNFSIIPVAEASGIGDLMMSINRVLLNPLIYFIFALVFLTNLSP